jgi:hypothetical protein
MQNSEFNQQSIKVAESVAYNFLWNKKADKSKAYERISRVKLKQSVSSGGISSPDIYSMCKALMIKQLIRSSSDSVKHSINYIQTDLMKYNPTFLFQGLFFKSGNSYIDKAVLYLSELGDTIIDEIIQSNEANKLHKGYYEIIASERTMHVIQRLTKNQIVISQARIVVKALGLMYVGQLINEYKFPSTDKYRQNILNIITACSPLFNILANRKCLSYGTPYRDGFFLTTNNPITDTQFTTKLIRQRLFQKQLIKTSKDFSGILKNLLSITHPKEREIAYFNHHGVLLTNDKLFDMKLVESPNCPFCLVRQTTFHIFFECLNSIEASLAVEFTGHLFSHLPMLKSNVIALVNRMLFLNRNKKVKSELFIVAIKNRIEDFDKISLHKRNEKNLNVINKITLM